MRTVTFFLLWMLWGFSSAVSAQTDGVFISVAMPSESILDGNSMSTLKNKLSQVLSRSGVVGAESSAIVLVPEVHVADSSSVFGGMRTISSVRLDVTLSVKHLITNTTFCSYEIETKGEAYSVRDAKRSAISRINALNPDYSKFIEEAKIRVCDYFSRNTSALISKANTLAVQKKYDEALALLSAYPESLSGFAEVSAAMSSILDMCKTEYCGQILMSAQSAFSKRDYAQAADIASMVDSQSSCAEQARALLESVRECSDKEHEEEIAQEKEKISSKERQRTAMINAVRDIASAYVRRNSGN